MWLRNKGVANFWRLLAETNELHGTSFGTTPADKATLIGADMFNGGVMALDIKNRRIAYLTKGGKSVEILDFHFIRAWRITWRDKSGFGGAQFGILAVGSAHTSRDKVCLEITTNDVERPIIRLPMSSLRWAQETSARLDIMINSKK
jgi:hypothetical protein